MTEIPSGGFGIPDGRGRPPATVRLAAAFFFAGAALTALWALVSGAAAIGLPDALRAELQATGDRLDVQVTATVVGLGLIWLLLAAVSAVAGASLLRGRPMGYWVALGLCGLLLAVSILCVVYGGALQNILALTADTAVSAVDTEDVTAALPDWYASYTLAHNVLGIVAFTPAGFLFVLPASGEHFTRRQPPTGGGGFAVPR
ncbi:hypothetical protein AB0I28_28260 [Phytomonospora sp. NPDC050363]|uniref:hypothetical protein n=1 Tax=Phytomonospora sp. NPDC050363 TaxID=3155642 RepID=UPI0033D7946F